MARQFANNATTLLADGISSTATELTVTPGTGGLFPAVNQAEDGNWFDLTLEDVNGVIEIMKCTVHGAGSNTLTIGERGLEGTTPSNFNADTRVEIRLTASALNGWFQPVGGVIDGGEFGDDDATITTIKSHRSVVADEQPPGGSLSLGELAINVTDGKMWVGNQAGDPVELVSGGSGSPTGAHNDLTGRTVALCHPFVSIYNPDDDNKNLADTLNDLVEEAPLDGDAYARMNGDWAAIDLSVPAAEWGSITGNLYSQSDLMAEFSEYGKRKSSVSVSGLWTFTGWTGYNSGLKCSGAYYGGNSGAMGCGISQRDYVNANGGSTGLVCNNFVLAVNSNGSISQPSLMSADQVQFLTNVQFSAALRQIANNIPGSLVTAFTQTPDVALAALLNAVADVVETTDYGTPDHDAVLAEMQTMFTQS